MTTRMSRHLIREGDYLAEVDVELHVDPPGQPGWGPYLNKDDAMRLDAVRLALRSGDLPTAGKHSRIYRVTPVSAA